MMGKLHMFMSIFFYVFCIIYAGRVIMHMHNAVENSRFDLVLIYIVSHFSGLFFEHDPGQSSESHCNNMTESVHCGCNEFFSIAIFHG